MEERTTDAGGAEAEHLREHLANYDWKLKLMDKKIYKLKLNNNILKNSGRIVPVTTEH